MKKLKPGIYETEYGNAAQVNNWGNKKAWDIDMGQHIPIEVVTSKFIRKIESADKVRQGGYSENFRRLDNLYQD